MDREGFRNKLKQYKEARELNPLLKYWEWKELPRYYEGTDEVLQTPLRPLDKKPNPSLYYYLDEIWQNENPNNIGYNSKTGLYTWHRSAEGGAPTIGPGFKYNNDPTNPTLKEGLDGLTKDQLNDYLVEHYHNDMRHIVNWLNQGLTTNPSDTISPLIKMGLLDLKHQTGSLNGWNKLRNAVLNGNIEQIQKLSTVTWKDRRGRVHVDERRKKLRDAKYFHYAEGGEVEPNKYSEIPVTGFDATTGKFTYGYNPSAGYVSGTDPVAETMMLGLGGGAAAAASRKLFPTYGAALGALAFGDADNMLVIPNNPTKVTLPISKNLVNKEVKLYYADDVIPRDVIHSDNKSFIDDANFTYDIYPSNYFEKNVAGKFDPSTGKIAINENYAQFKQVLDDVMAHEVDHLYNVKFPLDDKHTRILNRAYTVQDDATNLAARAARKESEKRATNKNIRHGLYVELKDRLGRTPTKQEVDDFIDSLPAQNILDRLRGANAYGGAYVDSIEDRMELLKTPINQYKKKRASLVKRALKEIAMNDDQTNSDISLA